MENWETWHFMILLLVAILSFIGTIVFLWWERKDKPGYRKGDWESDEEWMNYWDNNS